MVRPKPSVDVDNSVGVETPELDMYAHNHVTFHPSVKRQSGSTDDVRLMNVSDNVEENVKFSDQSDPYLYDMEGAEDPTRCVSDLGDATLDNFFSRPLKIHEEEWGTGTTLFFNINPWALYMQNSRVINRIINYNLLRSSLRVKIVINGNGFQYGRAIASYLPFPLFDTLSSNAALVSQDIVQASQQPHIYLNPTTSTGGELKLPFFYHENSMSIPESDWQLMGDLTVRSINDLKHANGASDKVTISVFAWIEDVTMSVLTSREPGTLIPQSGKASEVDEANHEGTISGPATALAEMACVAALYPPLTPFATATAIAAESTAEIAKMFGYCRPAITKAPEPYRPTPASSLAVTNVPDNAQKMTVDDKQELCIDPRISGLGNTDSLAIKEIAKRESYLTTFDWAMGTAPETLLWNARIDPVTWAEDGLTPNGFHFPACAMAALPFKYWTGTMNFRFQIVASAFHKGRIKIVYDPHFLASNEYNTNYIEIVDIAEKADFTMSFGNGQNRSLLTRHEPGVDSVTQMYSTTPYASAEEGNGVVGVYVVNELTTPNSTVNNDIQVNVYVSMGDDFEVFVPEDSFQNFVFKPQSGGAEEVPESFGTEEPDAPQQEASDTLGVGLSNHDKLGLVYTGESILSFRTLLKRYNLHTAVVDTTPAQAARTRMRHPGFPYLRGNVLGAVHTTGAFDKYNYCNTVLLHWVTLAFSGWRGSIRWKLIPRGNGGSVQTKIALYAQRAPIGEKGYYHTEVSATAYDQNSGAHSCITQKGVGNQLTNYAVAGTRGCCYTNDKVNNVLEYEVPFYSYYRFVPGKTENYTTTLQSEGADLMIFSNQSETDPMEFWCAAGEDFQTYFWTGLPRVYYEAAPPAPTRRLPRRQGD